MTPLRPRTTPIPLPAAAPPIDAIREAVREELKPILALVVSTAARAAAEAVAESKLRTSRVVMETIFGMLAVRLLLLLALAGGFVLALFALLNGSYQAGGVLVAYACLVLIPLVWLEARSKPNAT